MQLKHQNRKICSQELVPIVHILIWHQENEVNVFTAISCTRTSFCIQERQLWHCYGYSIYVPHITYPFITTRTFDIESLYHSTYLLNISFNTVFHHLKPKNSFLYLLHFCYIRVKDQCSRTCRVERSNLYLNTFLKWQAHLKCLGV